MSKLNMPETNESELTPEAPAESIEAPAVEAPEAPAESASDTKEAPDQKAPAPDENNPDSFETRQQVISLHRIGRVSWDNMFKVCVLRGWDIPTKSELLVKDDKKKQSAKLNPFLMPHVESAKKRIEKRFSKAKQSARKKHLSSIADSDAAVIEAKKVWESAKLALGKSKDALTTFDATVIKSDSQIEYLDKKGEKRNLKVSLGEDGKAVLAIASGKGSSSTENPWFAGCQYNLTCKPRKHNVEGTTIFTILKMSSATRIEFIRLDELPIWYNGKVKKGDIVEMSARDFFENEIGVKYNLRGKVETKGQVLTPTDAAALLPKLESASDKESASDQ